MFPKKIIALVFCLTLAAGSAHAEDGDYIFILKSRANPYWTAMVDGIKDAGHAQHISPIVYQLENETAAEEQLNLCMTAIDRKPKFLAVSSVTPSIGLQCLKKAAAAGILIADMDATISVAEAKAAGLDLAYSVGSDNLLIGGKAAQYAAKIINIPNPKIFVLEGAVGSIPGQKRVDGFRTELKKLLPSADVVSISADWDRLKAMNATSDMLQRSPDLTLVYAANDLMALGASEAVRNAKKQEQVKIIGVDGTGDARKAVLEGRLTATVAQLPYLIGKRSFEMGFEAVHNHLTGKTEITATPVLTKDMLQANNDAALQYVR